MTQRDLREWKSGSSVEAVGTAYVTTLVEMANEVLDFVSHRAVRWDSKSGAFTHRWSYLEGNWKKITKRTYRVYRHTDWRRILASGRSTMCMASGVHACSEGGAKELVIPFRVPNLITGVLRLTPPEDKGYGHYDRYLADCLARVVSHGFAGGPSLLPALQFGVLHRRHFLASSPNLPSVLKDYLSRLFEGRGLGLLRRRVGASANFRVVSDLADLEDALAVDNGRITFSLAESHPSASPHILAKTGRKPTSLTQGEIGRWLGAWSVKDRTPPIDPDPDYVSLFSFSRSHLAVPCVYNGRLYAILGVDSPRANAFSRAFVQAICILAAQAAPVIANAISRAQLRYLGDILDAIPEEIGIYDEGGHIIRMNKAKRVTFPKARKGQYCFQVFEHSEHKCDGCFASAALSSGKPIRQALWEYRDKICAIRRYFEISAGRIPPADGRGQQVVEISRSVDSRIAMLDWLADLEDQTPAKLEVQGDRESWLWDRMADGLRKMGFPGCRIYTYEPTKRLFFGKRCFPKGSYRGKRFADYCLEVRNDIPSRKLLVNRPKRPVRFILNPDMKVEVKSAGVARGRHGYITYYLRHQPPKCTLNLKKGLCWVDIPIMAGQQVVGKLSVDKGYWLSGEESFVTDWEMSLLAFFGRFASLSLQLVRQTDLLVQTKEKTAVAEMVAPVAHELGNLHLSLKGNYEILQRRVLPMLDTALCCPVDWIRSGALPLVCRIVNKLSGYSARQAPGRYEDSHRPIERILRTLRRFGFSCGVSDVLPMVMVDAKPELLQLLALAKKRTERAPLEFVLGASKIASHIQTAIEKEETAGAALARLTSVSLVNRSELQKVDFSHGLNASARIIELLSPLATPVVVRYPRRDPGLVWSYGNSLRLLWINLLKNALQAGGGRRPIYVSVRSTKDDILVRIRDSGPGLPKWLRHVYAFSVVPGPRFPVSCTGVRSIMEVLAAHRGDIAVISSGSRGTMLEVHIPREGAKS